MRQHRELQQGRSEAFANHCFEKRRQVFAAATFRVWRKHAAAALELEDAEAARTERMTAFAERRFALRRRRVAAAVLRAWALWASAAAGEREREDAREARSSAVASNRVATAVRGHVRGALAVWRRHAATLAGARVAGDALKARNAAVADRRFAALVRELRREAFSTWIRRAAESADQAFKLGSHEEHAAAIADRRFAFVAAHRARASLRAWSAGASQRRRRRVIEGALYSRVLRSSMMRLVRGWHERAAAVSRGAARLRARAHLRGVARGWSGLHAAFLAWQDAVEALQDARRAARLSPALTHWAITRHAKGVAVRHLRCTFRGWYAAARAWVFTPGRRRAAAASVAAASRRRDTAALRRAFAALAAAGRRRHACLAADVLLAKVVAASQTLRGLRMKRRVVTAMYAAAELSRAWHLTLADVGVDLRHARRVACLRAWRCSAQETAAAAVAEEDHKDAVFVMTTRNSQRVRAAAERRAFDAWWGVHRAAVRACSMERRAVLHRARVERRAAGGCWRAWLAETRRGTKHTRRTWLIFPLTFIPMFQGLRAQGYVGFISLGVKGFGGLSSQIS